MRENERKEKKRENSRLVSILMMQNDKHPGSVQNLALYMPRE